MSDAIYDAVTRGLIRCIEATPDGTPKTRQFLRRCAKVAGEECERLCPAMLEFCGDGVRSYYGPDVPVGYSRLAVFATPKIAMTVGFNEWPPLVDSLPQVQHALYWHEIAKAVRKADGALALMLLAHRAGAGGLAILESQSRALLTEGWTPTIIALAADRNGQACGAVTVMPLPRTLASQMATFAS